VIEQVFWEDCQAFVRRLNERVPGRAESGGAIAGSEHEFKGVLLLGPEAV
jgi:hypothetical protein